MLTLKEHAALKEYLKKRKIVPKGDEIPNLLPRIGYSLYNNAKGEQIYDITKHIKHHGEVRDVPVNSIFSNQDTIFYSGLKNKISGADESHDPPIPYVVRHIDTNKHEMIDGNTRGSAELVRGSKTMKALVVDVHPRK